MPRWTRCRPLELRCPICLDQASEAAKLPCGHALCGECLVSYVESLVNQGSSAAVFQIFQIWFGKVAAEQLVCPLPECRSSLPPNTLSELIRDRDGGAELFQRLIDFQAQRFVPEQGDDERLLNCPTAGCMKMLVPLELVEARADVNCPQCRQSFCAGCCQASHLGSCEEAELRRLDPEMRKLMEQESWVRCPACRHLCERESGCNFMTCPSEQCKGATFFCYLCGELLAASDHASHYEGFRGAIGLRGPFGSVCLNRQASSENFLPLVWAQVVYR
ncbi:unnamed protein product [Effrenium voratum]|nr:unnamed protein product [Effrenium voratum]